MGRRRIFSPNSHCLFRMQLGFVVFCACKMQPRRRLGSPLPLARSDRRRAEREAPRGTRSAPRNPGTGWRGKGARIGAAFAKAKDVTTAVTQARPDLG